MENKMQKLLEDLVEEGIVRLPISTLDGIKCMVSLRGVNGLDVDIVYKYGKGSEPHKRINHDITDKELSIEGLRQAIDDIDKIKFSKKLNEFVFEEKETYEELFTSNNYENAFQDCPVCLEKTVRQTSCSHFLCLRCYLKIEKVCPICRKDINDDRVDHRFN